MKLHNKDIYVPLPAFSYEYSPAVNMFDIFTAHIVQLNQVCEFPFPLHLNTCLSKKSVDVTPTCLPVLYL